MKSRLATAAVVLACAAPSWASAQLAISANDGKQLRPGETPASRTADSVSVIDLGRSPPALLGSVEVPASLTGPPTTVAVASDGRFAIVTAPQKVDPADPTKLAPNDVVSVIDLSKPAAPKVVQTLQGGVGATGVSINKARTLALIANSGEDSISVFTIRGQTLTPAGKVKLDAQSRPTDVAFTPDGKGALVVAQGAGKVLRLSVDGTKVALTPTAFQTGVQPYGVVVSRKGDYAFNTNLQGRPTPPGATVDPRAPRIGTISVLDLKANTVGDSVDAGPTPEHLSLSPDGAYLQTTIVNGSNAPATAAGYHPFGLMKVYRVQGGKLDLAAETQTGQWCQGAVWSRDGKQILLQCAMAKEIEVYRFDGKSLTRDPAATLKLGGRPGAMATAFSR